MKNALKECIVALGPRLEERCEALGQAEQMRKMIMAAETGGPAKAGDIKKQTNFIQLSEEVSLSMCLSSWPLLCSVLLERVGAGPMAGVRLDVTFIQTLVNPASFLSSPEPLKHADTRNVDHSKPQAVCVTRSTKRHTFKNLSSEISQPLTPRPKPSTQTHSWKHHGAQMIWTPQTCD